MTASPTEPREVETLSAADAQWILERDYLLSQHRMRLYAIRDGQHRVVPVMTEAQAREAFIAKYGDDWMERRGTSEWCAWRDALRAHGLIGDTNG